VGNLTSPTLLSLASNRFTGGIDAVTKLTRLTALYLWANQLEGRIYQFDTTAQQS
jgi:hypothetical protein